MGRTAPDVGNYSLGKGKLYFERLVSDVGTGEIDLGNTPAFSLSPTVETLDHFSSMSGLKEKDKSVDISVGFTGKFTVDEYSRENLMLALLGSTETTETQSTGHQVNEPITARLDRWVKLGKRNVTVLKVTDLTGLVAYIEDTDYSVDTAVGRISAIRGGSITDAQSLLVDYTYDATTYPKILAVETSTIEGLVRFVGNPDVGPKYECVIWKAKLKPTGDLSFVGDDWGKIEFELEVLKDEDNHPTEPWFVLLDITTNDAVQS